MNVDALLLHLNNLSHLLREAGANASANDLRKACELLNPFKGQKLETVLKEFEKSQKIVRDAGAASGRGKSKISPEIVAAIGDRIAALHERAGQPGLTEEEIETMFTDAKLEILSAAQLVAIAARLNVPKIKGPKAKIIDTIKKAVGDRKGAILRVGI